MKIKIYNRLIALALLALLLALHALLSSAFAQGSLTPPGPPATTMLTLSQIEPRTPVDAGHTPGDGNSYLFIISQPGSYYLTTNIVGVVGESAIEIATNNVSLDLNGFSILGIPTDYAPNGISIPSVNVTNITVHNGMISGWPNGGGVYSYADNVTLEHLTVQANNFGVECNNNTMVRDCTVDNNYYYGIDVIGSDCFITGNHCNGNDTSKNAGIAGIYVDGSNNRIEGNHITGTFGNGIFILNIAGVTNNIVVQNSVEGDGANDYSFNASQIVGPIITNAVSGIITNSNPWANFSF